MKKILVAIVLSLLVGCTNKADDIEKQKQKFLELGYKENNIAKIFSMSDETKQYLLEEYDIEKESLVINEKFIEKNLKQYEKFLYLFDTNTLIYLVNNEYLNRDTVVDIYRLCDDEFYISKNMELYMQYKDKKDDEGNQKFNDIRSLVEWVNCKCYKEPFVDQIPSDLTVDPCIIASKIYFLGEYEPDDLVLVDSKYTHNPTWTLREEAYNNYIEMYEAAKEEELDFFITSAYRSYDYQDRLYNKYLATDTKENVDTYSARPGCSDHQSGMTVDILKDGYSFANFETCDEAKWLHENAHKYGFIVRYPEGKEEITGYIPESWHFRYVGKEAAQICYEKQITFDEYYAYYIENKLS